MTKRYSTKAQALLLLRYRAWSKLQWASTFIHPGPDRVRAFRDYDAAKAARGPIPLEDYEIRFLDEYERQEREATT